MLSFTYENALSTLALVMAAAALATLLRLMLAGRDRLRPGVITLRPVSSRQPGSGSADIRRISARPCGLQVTHGCGASPRRWPAVYAWEQPAGGDQAVDATDGDLGYLDPLDRAGVLSFPASDPPAVSGPA